MTSSPHRRGCTWALALGVASLALAVPAGAADETPADAAEAAAPATAASASAPASLPKDRCPTMPVPAIRGHMPYGEHLAKVRFLLKADGSVTQIRVEARRAPKPFLNAVWDAVTGYKCLPGDTDLDIATEFRLKISSR